MKKEITMFFIIVITFMVTGWFLGVYLEVEKKELFGLLSKILSAFIALWGILYVQYKIKMREIDARLFEKKASKYHEFISLLFKIQREEIKNEDAKNKLIETREAVYVWGQEKMLIDWKKYEALSAEAVKKGNNDDLFNHIFKMIRSDLGHQDSKDFDYVKTLFKINK